MTGAEFYAYVLRIFRRTDKSTETYEAMTDIVRRMRTILLPDAFKKESYTTGIDTLGEYRLCLPDDFGTLIGDITLTDVDSDETYPPLKKLTKESYDALYYDRLNSTTGAQNIDRPIHYCIFDDYIYLGPVPDKTTYRYQLNYSTNSETEIDSSTDPVPFTDRFRDVVRCGVLSELYYGINNDNEGVKWDSKFREGLTMIQDRDDKNTGTCENIMYRGL